MIAQYIDKKDSPIYCDFIANNVDVSDIENNSQLYPKEKIAIPQVISEKIRINKLFNFLKEVIEKIESNIPIIKNNIANKSIFIINPLKKYNV